MMYISNNSIHAFQCRLATMGLAIAVLAFAAGLIALLLMFGSVVGFLDPSTTASVITSILSLVGIVVIGLGALGYGTVYVTDHLLVRPAGISIFRVWPSASTKLKSILRGILPPPPRDK